MSKYIIELDDRIKLVTSVGVTENGVVYTTSDYVNNLEELNSDYINEHFGELQDEAYKQGYAEAERIWRAPSSDNEFYQKGLEDAWKATKRIFGYEIDGGIPIDRVREAFGYAENAIFCTADIIRDYTVQEAIDKIKAYDDKQKGSIEVGDEVRFLPNDRKGIVTACHVPDVYAENDKYAVFCGTTVEYVLRPHITKTGKHYDIQSILEAMRE